MHLTAEVEGGGGCLGVTLPERVEAGDEAEVTVATIDAPGYYGSLAGRVRIGVDGVPSSSAVAVYGYMVDDARGVRTADAPVCRVEGGYLNFGQKPRGTLRVAQRGAYAPHRAQGRDAVLRRERLCG